MAKLSVPDEPGNSEVQPNGNQPNATMASLAHWSFLLSFIPFAPLIIPIVLLVSTQGKEDAFVRDNAREALNLLICAISVLIPIIILCFVCIGYFLLAAFAMYMVIFPIIAGVETMGSSMNTPVYRYPCIFRLLK